MDASHLRMGTCVVCVDLLCLSTVLITSDYWLVAARSGENPHPERDVDDKERTAWRATAERNSAVPGTITTNTVQRWG